MARDLTAERNARIREQERAEVAAHVHDSVLHTLTLIQRHVDDPREVARLARAQERELRGWLYRPAADAARHDRGRARAGRRRGRGRARRRDRGRRRRRLPAGRAAAARCCDAAREAMVNAAKYAGGARRSRSTPRWSRTRSRCSSATAGPGFDPRRRARGPAGPATVGHRPDGPPRRHGRRSAASPGTAPRSSSRCPAGAPVTATVHRRSPRAARRPARCGSCWSTTTGCSAAACAPSSVDDGRGRRRGRGRRAAVAVITATAARRGAARRPPARRRRPGGAAGAGAASCPTCASWRCRCPTRPRT